MSEKVSWEDIPVDKLGFAAELLKGTQGYMKSCKSPLDALQRVVGLHSDTTRKFLDILDANKDAVLAMIPEKDREKFCQLHDRIGVTMAIMLAVAGFSSSEQPEFERGVRMMTEKAELAKEPPAGTA